MRTRLARRGFLCGAAGVAGAASAGCLSRRGPDLTTLDEWPPARHADALSFWTWQEYWGNQARAFEFVGDLESVEQGNLGSREQFGRLRDGGVVDVVHIASRYFGRSRDSGLLQSLPVTEMPAWSRREEPAAHGFDYYRRDGAYYGLPQTPMIDALAYHSELVEEPDSWAILWDEAHAGRITMPADPVLACQIAALYTGQDPNDPDDVDDVEAALARQRPLLAGYWTDWMTTWRRFGAGDLVASVLPSPRMCLCSQDGTPVRRVAPTEGVLYGYSTLAIPDRARHPWTALEFVDWAATYKTGGRLMWTPEEWTLYHARPLDEAVRERYREAAARVGVGEA